MTVMEGWILIDKHYNADCHQQKRDNINTVAEQAMADITHDLTDDTRIFIKQRYQKQKGYNNQDD